MIIPFEKTKELEKAHSLLKVLSNKRRLAIACLLHDAELAVGEIEAQLDLSQSALSQHLQLLRDAGIVKSRQDGRNVYYTLHSKEARSLINTLHQLFCS